MTSKNGRHLWTPKLPEATQCASCPFKRDNDKEHRQCPGATAVYKRSVQ